MGATTPPETDGESTADGLCLAERPGGRLIMCTLPADHGGPHEAYDEIADRRDSWSGPVGSIEEAM